MISRIEKISDLIDWLESLKMLHTKNVSFPELTPEQDTALSVAQEVLSEATLHDGPFKQCCKCFSIWPETEEWFDSNRQGRTGLHSDCKFCRNDYQKKRKKTKKTTKRGRPSSSGLTYEEAKRIQEAGMVG